MYIEVFSQSVHAENLLLFFNGWAMNPAVVRQLAVPVGYDLAVCQDYRTVHFPRNLSTERYSRVILIAWSMGVWAAEQLQLKGELPTVDGAVAIAGTPIPRHNDYGIRQGMFDATLRALSDENRIAFNERMCGGERPRNLFNALAERSTDEIRAELSGVRELSGERIQSFGFSPQVKWSKALVPLNDLIIPPGNQLRYWQTYNVPIVELPGSEHYIFNRYRSWIELI